MGISTKVEILNPIEIGILPLEEIPLMYKSEINFIEYNSISQKIKKFLEWREEFVCTDPLPRNCAINTLLNMDKKGSSKS